MLLTRFAHHAPRSPEGVTSLLAELGEASRVHAGGTDLVVQLRTGAVAPAHVIDISAVPGLGEIERLPDGGLRIGARVTMSQIRTDEDITSRFPALAESAAEVGSRQIQNRATLAGNVCNASPAADTVPALYVFEASVNVLGPRGPRTVPIDEFAAGPRSTVLASDEWVTSIDLPTPLEGGSAYVKLGRTPGVDLAIVGVACIVGSQHTRLAFASVGPTVRSAPGAETALRGASAFTDEAVRAIGEEIAPIDDVRASADYRRAVAPVLARRAWEQARMRCPGG